MKKISPNDACPCHSGKKYKKCCRLVHGGQEVDDPRLIMRARYSAYVIQNMDFITGTMHPESHHLTQRDRGEWIAALNFFATQTDFVDLDVLDLELSPDDLNTAWVTFHATLIQGEEDISYSERSLFKKLNGRWLYLHADPIMPETE